jgi:hypothetical protein
MTHPDKQFMAHAHKTYIEANRSCLNWMLDRPSLQGAFLNTKMNSLTLQDYTVEDGLRGPSFTYGWIQGRGLEALIAHAQCFSSLDPDLSHRLDTRARALYADLRDLYLKYDRAYFLYDATMSPVYPTDNMGVAPQSIATGYYTYSDAFVLKGLIAAASRFEPRRVPLFLEHMAQLVGSIEGGTFIQDERQRLDSGALARQDDNYGPRMILLGAAAMLQRLGYWDAAAFGRRFIAHVLEHHVHQGSAKGTVLLRDLPGGDYCNPGHAIEFVGFALDYLQQSDRQLILTLEKRLRRKSGAGARK